MMRDRLHAVTGSFEALTARAAAALRDRDLEALEAIAGEGEAVTVELDRVRADLAAEALHSGDAGVCERFARRLDELLAGWRQNVAGVEAWVDETRGALRRTREGGAALAGYAGRAQASPSRLRAIA
ncbi:hypothetical protein [Nitrospira sp. Kam-Ns4a]